MQVRGSSVLSTGANRGIGKALQKLFSRPEPAKIYAGARDPAHVTTHAVTPIALDITNVDQVARAAQQCSDVNLLINDAGIGTATPFIAAPDLRDFKAAMDI